ncbi:MAG: transposase [Sphingobacteriales bacterium]|nr:transposase [Sphingobacteriales bacterium]MBK6888450.1 transposase [Sphingobacteriales bacterium]MBK6890294.1 transposase [Sphingobacteriales bacterium]MBK7528990.1 transposase [Sphingobacteriales bacterium]MBK8679014.1 transposase [Sphingobacteriales bacterium]
MYKLRQQIVEHPYGTIKRQWGYSYIITKRGIERAAADVGLIMTAYNLRRLFNILPRELFKTWLKTLFLFFVFL